MTVETTLQKMYDLYPLLYSTRQECFNHLFCEIGNGYKWQWGQIVHVEGEDETVNEDDYAHPYALHASQSKKNLEKKKECLKMLEIAGVPKPERWSELNEKYSLIYHVPKNARPDWKAAVEECKDMLEADGIIKRKPKC